MSGIKSLGYLRIEAAAQFGEISRLAISFPEEGSR